jgi:gamma-D-glutamyl-L-lysine dipeptidyl-peptidase
MKELLKRAFPGALVLTQAVVLAAVPCAAEPRREAVIVPTVENLYSVPDADKDVSSQAYIGQVVGVLETKGAFARIETPDQYVGWIPRSAILEYPDTSSPRYAQKGKVADVVALLANIYREDDVTTARPKAQAPLGARLEVSPASAPNGWHIVRLPDGQEGFVQAGDVSVHDAGDTLARGGPEDLLKTARRMMGVPYLWGGMTPLGLDCSGFVDLVYRVHGKILPRDTGPQFADPSALKVEKDALQPGDLLYFGGKNISHVGMYLGEGRFINATTHLTPAVREDRLDDPYWIPLYKGARRPQ